MSVSTPLKDLEDYKPAMVFLTRVDHEALLGTGNYTQRIDQTVPEHAACFAFQTVITHKLCTMECRVCAFSEIPLIRNFNHQFASRYTRCEISMCLAYALGRERVLSINVDFQSPTRNQSPEFCAVAIAFLESH